MPSYPAHYISGVALDDPAGRWHEGTGTVPLSVFPGARTAGYQLPGVGGTLPIPIAPVESSTVSLQVVFNAVNSSGRIVSGVGERAAAISKHINDFLLATQLGASTWVGSIEVERRMSATDVKVADCRIAASVTPDHYPGSDHATVLIVLDNMSGLWRGVERLNSNSILPTGVNTPVASLSPSTAVIQDALIGITGPAVNPIVRNEQGNGFQLLLTIPAGRSVVVNSRLWSYGETKSGSPAWGDLHLNRGALRPVGQASARALSIIPRLGGGSIRFSASGTTDATKVTVNSRKAFY